MPRRVAYVVDRRALALSATPDTLDRPFGLDETDLVHGELRRRYTAGKAIRLTSVENGVQRVERLFELAITLTELLLTMPGIDALAAAKRLVEIGDDMNAFSNVGKLAKWAGICPGNGESAGKRKRGKTTKGSRYLRALLCGIAWAAARTAASAFKSRYLRRRPTRTDGTPVVARQRFAA